MIRADHTEPTAYALAIARNTHAWDNWLRLFSRAGQAIRGEAPTRCHRCNGAIREDLGCPCFDVIAEGCGP